MQPPELPKGIIDSMEDNPIRKALSESKASIHVIRPDYAYLKVGKMRFYFHNTSWAKAYQEERELASGEKAQVSIIPYDGWEVDVTPSPFDDIE